MKDGAEIILKILTAPEKYESLYGEKIRLDIRVDGNNDKCDRNIKLHHIYTVSSAAACWRALHAAWRTAEDLVNAEFGERMTPNDVLWMQMRWVLSAKEVETAKGTRTIYILKALGGDDDE